MLCKGVFLLAIHDYDLFQVTAKSWQEHPRVYTKAERVQNYISGASATNSQD